MNIMIIEIVTRVSTRECDLVCREGFLEEITFKLRVEGEMGISQTQDRGF